MQIEKIFPQAVIGLSKLEVDLNKVLKHIENIEFEKTIPSLEKEASIYTSKNFKIFEEITYLKNEVFNNVKNYLNNIMKLKMDFQFTTSWVTKTLPNGYSQKHLHANSFLSGVYYPKGNKNFNIKFYKGRNFWDCWDIDTTEINTLNAAWYNFNIPEDNVLILFPSHLLHSVEKNLSNEIRYSIAFNILPLGEIGKNASKINFNYF
jgi:uncharacterized protein (TIGR02466 family)